MNDLPASLDEYLALRRSFGFALRDAGTALRDFVGFLEHQGASFITTALALQWAQQPLNVQPAHWAARLSMVRGFARYRAAEDPRTEIPPVGLLPHRYLRKEPYLYSDAEIAQLLDAATKLIPS